MIASATLSRSPVFDESSEGIFKNLRGELRGTDLAAADTGLLG
jgi:hypothetical protein